MGLIDFVKNAGAKLFGKGDENAAGKRAEAAAQRVARANKGAAAAALVTQVNKLGLTVENLGDFGRRRGGRWSRGKPRARPIGRRSC